MIISPLLRPVPQALTHLIGTISSPRIDDATLQQVNALPEHLRRDLGLAPTRQSITFVNDAHK